MIVSISGISTSIPSSYEEIKRRLRQLGLSPSGNYEVDKSRLKQAINSKVEKAEEKKREVEKKEEQTVEKRMEEERLGAQTLGEQNKIFFRL